MITGLCKLVAKIDFATTQLFWREHLIDGSHASEIVIMMTAYEVDVNEFMVLLISILFLYHIIPIW